jgi:hypothetical protein
MHSSYWLAGVDAAVKRRAAAAQTGRGRAKAAGRETGTGRRERVEDCRSSHGTALLHTQLNISKLRQISF